VTFAETGDHSVGLGGPGELLVGVGLDEHCEVLPEGDPVVVGDRPPPVGLVDEVDHEAALEGLQHQQVEVHDVGRRRCEVLDREGVLQVAAAVVGPGSGQGVALEAVGHRVVIDRRQGKRRSP
jgi:hypothetical protein